MAVLDLFPARVAIGHVNKQPVYASDEFLRALRVAFLRLGGAIGPSTTDLAVSDDDDSGLEEFKAEMFKALTGLDLQPRYEPSREDQLEAEIASLREEIAVLRTAIDAINQGAEL
jgi:hypothetical protein